MMSQEAAVKKPRKLKLPLSLIICGFVLFAWGVLAMAVIDFGQRCEIPGSMAIRVHPGEYRVSIETRSVLDGDPVSGLLSADDMLLRITDSSGAELVHQLPTEERSEYSGKRYVGKVVRVFTVVSRERVTIEAMVREGAAIEGQPVLAVSHRSGYADPFFPIIAYVGGALMGLIGVVVLIVKLLG